jgi:hypothetical protein
MFGLTTSGNLNSRAASLTSSRLLTTRVRGNSTPSEVKSESCKAFEVS